jgi:hypothetical protein
MLNVARGGTADRLVTEVAVKPVGSPELLRRVTIATPELWRRKFSKKSSDGEEAAE